MLNPQRQSSRKVKTSTAAISFEFFPPKSDIAADKLWTSVRDLSPLEPKFVSITCGAGGSAIDGTAAVVQHISKNFGVEAVPHVAIARQSRTRLREALSAYVASGVTRVVAVRGDEAQPHEIDFGTDIYANTVEFVRDLHQDFGLAPIVAAYPDVHPKALSSQHDIDHLRLKQDAGAAMAVSQFFFVAETFLRFRDKIRAAGITLPLSPGIMPIHNLAQIVRFAGGCGTLVPEGFGHRFERHQADADALFKEGVAHAAELCDHLRREGVEHFHFYTLNRSEMTLAICQELGLPAAVSA